MIVLKTKLIFDKKFILQTLTQLINGELSGATTIKISEGLDTFPGQLFELTDTLEYLDLSSNKLTTLPDDFSKFKKLKVFFASDNCFTVFPSILGRCDNLQIIGFKSNLITHIPNDSLHPNLRWLILTNNQISSLPASIGECSKLEKLMLAGNKLTALPKELADCGSLALLRIAANHLTKLPEWLVSMPGLAWLAFSGNNMINQIKGESFATVNIDQFQLRQLLGEGASGTIFKATSIDVNNQDEVAIKIFKGSVTSDGFPEDELQTYLAAGHHPSIVKLKSVTELDDQGKKGLVMELIPPHFYNLGKPPTLNTCTRDVFDKGFKLTDQQLFEIATSMASVGAHLHERGIIHGDLYAHNVLVDDAGKTLFGDFGAASSYDKRDLALAFHLERIEVKAFGFLLDDLLSLCSADISAFDELCKLRNLCLSENQHLRPGFNEILTELTLLRSS